VTVNGYTLTAVHGASIPQPQFPDDDGRADPRLSEALLGYAAGRVGEHTVIEEFYGARLLVPVVAMLTEEAEVAPGELRREKQSEMALPTLIGDDGRRAVLGFTSLESLARWRADARPVAVHARQACQAALDEQAHALVVDVAGPVPFAVDGYRLHLLAEGRPIPPPHEDPEVLAAIEAAFAPEHGVTGVQVGKGTSAELSIRFAVTGDLDERATVQRVTDRLAGILRGRTIGGIELGVVRR
jgi:SseB protein N-terminal domain